MEVYENNMVRLSQQEADMVGKLAEKAKQPGSKTEQHIEQYQKLMKP
ncbi:MAG: hypothetical protein PVJ15_08895 [Gammaproteobacteria bacterium]